jgi:uncharacterized protein (DUF433 family)
MITDALEPLPPNAPDPERGTWIRKTRGVCGGDACIRNTRIPVWLLEGWRRRGVGDADILAQYPGLTPLDLVAAWEYAAANAAEIEKAIGENEEA